LLFYFLGFEHHALGLQVRGQRLTHGTHGGGGSGRDLVGHHWRGRHQRFHASQQQFELLGIQTFILSAAEVTLEEEREFLPEQLVLGLQGRE
jgi:hypothetical protein